MMPAEYESFATATVKLTLEVRVGDSWPPNAAIDQVYRQAAESAIQQVRTALRLADPEDAAKAKQAMRILDAEVTAVLTQRQKR